MANRYGYDYPDLTSDDSNDIKRVLAEREANPGAAPPRARPGRARPGHVGVNLYGYAYPELTASDGPDVLQLLNDRDREFRLKEAGGKIEGAVQGPYHRLQMRFWFEKGFFEMKTPVRFGLSGPFTMLGDAFGAAAAGEYVWAFLDDAAIAKKRDQAEELKNRPTQNPHGTWKQKHLKVPATRENPFPNEDFESPGQELYWCAHAGETRAALKLIEEGADVLWRNHNEQCILSAAAKAGDVEIIRALVKCGAPPSHENIWHMTPLHEAARANRGPAIRALVDLGADMEVRDLDGYKPIHTACTTNAVDAIRELVLLGSTTTIRDNHNWTPIMHVLNHGMDARKKAQIIQLIRKECE
ncbi:hypothetical protein JL720_3661 [Aureococcus anophagefferens]|nr:hypothetical protein JL720_3661 [Aureococcus anophagefferens]